MSFIVYVCCWYVMVFVVYLIEVAWHAWCAKAYTHPQEPMLALKEGETIAAVADRPTGIRFYTEIDVVGGKSYE